MRRNWILWLEIFVLMLICTVVFTCCTSPETNTGSKMAAVSETAIQSTIITNVSAQEAYTLIQEKSDNPNFRILDVRTPDEYNTGHVEGAINVDYNSDTFKDILATLDRSGEYLVYCRDGERSSGAIEIMEDLEFTMVYHIKGGIIEWSAEGLPFAR